MANKTTTADFFLVSNLSRGNNFRTLKAITLNKGEKRGFDKHPDKLIQLHRAQMAFYVYHLSVGLSAVE